MTTRTDVKVIYDTDPRLIIVDAPSTEITIQDLHDTLSVIDAQFTSMSFPHTLKTTGKENLGGGVFVGLTTTLQNAQVAFERRTTQVSTGTITTAGVIGAFFQTVVDAGATFVSDGVARGDIVENTTDGSFAEVISIDSETQLSVLSPTGGTDDDYDVSDGYIVWLHETGDITGGNLVAVETDGLTLLQQTFPTFGVGLVRASSSSATLSEQADIQYSSFGGGVTIDVTSSNTGTVFPVGTPREPVNNTVDAELILTSRGFDAYFIRGDITVDSGIHPYLWQGQAVSLTTITLDPAADLTGARFANATITGTLDGDAALSQCNIQTLNFFNGVISGCVLSGTITLGGGIQALILDSFSDVGGATIDLGASGQDLDLQNFNGDITLTNKSGAGDDVIVGLGSGSVTVDNTVTAGTITLNGIGIWNNRETYSGGATVINNLIDGTLIQTLDSSAYDSRITVDSVDGVAGTTYPTGTPAQPSNNLTDALTIGNTQGISVFHLHTDETIPIGPDFSGADFEGHQADVTITVPGAATAPDLKFRNIEVTGVLSGESRFTDCRLMDISVDSATCIRCGWEGTITLTGISTDVCRFVDCYGSGNPVLAQPALDFGGDGPVVTIARYAGALNCSNKTGTAACGIIMQGGLLTLDADVTTGTVFVAGIVNAFTNNATATVNDINLTTDQGIANTLLATSVDTKTVSNIYADLLSMATGRIVESPTGTFTFYEQDNTTVRFVLTKSGNERIRS